MVEFEHGATDSTYHVSKRVPIDGIATTFMYGFSLPVQTVAEMNDKIAKCKTLIDVDIMAAQ